MSSMRRMRARVCDDTGGVPKRPTGADCKSAGSRLRRFESFPHHPVRVEPEDGAGRKGEQRIAGVAQLVERKPSKLDVAGSSPVSRSDMRVFTPNEVLLA